MANVLRSASKEVKPDLEWWVQKAGTRIQFRCGFPGSQGYSVASVEECGRLCLPVNVGAETGLQLTERGEIVTY